MTALETLILIARNSKRNAKGRFRQLTKDEVINLARDYCIDNSISFKRIGTNPVQMHDEVPTPSE